MNIPPQASRFVSRLALIAAFLVALLTAPPLQAQSNFTWDVATGDSAITDGSGTWQVGVGNWYNGTSYDQNWANGNNAIFGGGTAGAAGTVTLGGNVTANNMTAKLANGGGSYTFDLAGFTLNLTQTTTRPILTFGNLVFNNGTLITNTTGTQTFITQNTSTTGTSTFNSKITGAGNVNAAGNDLDLILNNVDNDFTGILGKTNRGWIILQNIADSGAASSAGAGSQVNLGTNTTGLSFVGAAGSTNRTITLGGSGTSKTIENNGTGALVFTGSITSSMSGSLILTLGGNYSGANEIQGVLANRNATITLGVTKAGSTTWILSGNNTYTGATTISEGTLQIGSGSTSGSLSTSSAITNNANLVFNRSDTITQGTDFASAAISGNGSLAQNGSGNLVLNASNTYTGATTINAGTLSISSIANGGLASNVGQSTNAAGNLVLGGGELAYTGSTASTDRNFTLAADTTSTINVTESGTTLTISGAAASTNGSFSKAGAGSLVLSGNNTYSGTTTISAGTLEIGATGRLGAGTYSANIANNGVLVYSGTNAQTLSGEISGSGALTRNGAGILTLTGNNSYAGTTTISAGTLTLNNAANNNQTIQGDILIDGGVLSFGSVDNQIADSSNVTITSGTLNLGSRMETINSLNMGGGNLIYGNLTLGASSSFTGGSSMRQTGSTTSQKLTTYGTTTLGDTTFVYSHASTDAGGGLVLNGDIVVNSNTTADFTNEKVGRGRIILNDANRVFDVGSGANMNVAWRIRSVTDALGALTKNGSGTLTLTAQNPYGNGTTINEGTLVLGTATDTLSNTGAVTINGGTLSLGANSDTVGTVTLAGGDITGTTGVLTGSSYELQSGNVTAILGGASIAATKTTTGTVILSGANTFTGDTVVNAGTLEANASGALGSTANITVTGGSLLVTADNAIGDSTGIDLAGGNLGFSGNVTDTIGALTLSANSVIDLGTGSVTAIFADLFMGSYTLAVHNWTGTTLWDGGTGNNTDKIYFNRNLSSGELDRISFYSDFGSSFIGTGFQLGLGSGFQYEVIPVPEAETWVAAVALLAGAGAAWMRGRRRFKTSTQ